MPGYSWLVADVRAVLAGGTAHSHLEVCAARGSHRFEARPMAGGGAAVTIADETERLAREDDLAQGSAEFRALVEASGQVVWRTDAEGEAVSDGPTWGAFADGDPNAWSHQSWIGEVHPDDADDMAQRWAEAVRAQSIYEAEFRIRDAETGGWRWATERGVPLTDSDGAFVGHIGINTDITEKREAAEAVRDSERRFRALVEASAETVWEADAEGNILNESSGWEATTGQSPDEYIGDGWLAAVHPEDGRPMFEAWGAAVAAGLPFEYEFRVRRASDGAWRWTRSRAVPLFDADGAVERYIGTTTDISDRHEAEDLLRASERRFRALVEASSETVWEADADGRVLGDTPLWRTITGQAREDWQGLGWLEAVHPDDLAGVLEVWMEIVESGAPGHFEFLVRRTSDGTWRRMSTRVVPLLDADGAVEGYVGMDADITDRHAAVEAMRASERRFRALVEVSAETVWECDADGLAIGDSPSWRAFTGQTLEEWQGTGWLAAVHPDDLAGLGEAWGTSVETGSEYHHEFRVRRASDGAWRWMVGRAAPLIRADGTVEGYMGMNADITEQREASEAVKARERRFRALVEASAEVVWQTGADGRWVGDTPTWMQFSGQSYEEGADGGWFDAIHPDDQAILTERWAAIRSGGPAELGDPEASFRIWHKPSETWRWVTSRWASVWGPDGAFEGYVGMNRDVHEEHEAAESLRASERRFRALVDVSSETVWQADADGLAIGDSPSWRAFTGQSVEAWQGMGWLDAVHSEDQPGVAEAWRATAETGADFHAEFRVRRGADGAWRWMSARATSLRRDDGTVEGHVGMNTDVTEQRQASQALQASERRFRALVEASSKIVWECDAAGNVISRSPGWEALTGQSWAKSSGIGWQDVVHPDDREAIAEAWFTAFAAGTDFEHEFHLRRASDGAWRRVRDRAVPLLSDDGTVEGYVGMNIDITEQWEAAEALRASEARFRAIAETIPNTLFTIETTGEVSYVSHRFVESVGVDPSGFELVDDWLSTFHPDDRETVEAAWAASLASGEPLEVRFRTPRKDTGDRWVIVRARLVAAGDGQPPRWYGTATDIDALVRAEHALSEANETLEARVRAETQRVRQLAAALAVAEQSERRRIADVLHDNLQQQLYGLALLMARLQAEPASDERERLLIRCEEIVDEASAITRDLATDLAPPALDSTDACDLARWLASETERLHHLVVDVESSAEGPCVVLDMSVRALLYRTLRELLFNVAKHADVDHAHLRLDVEAGWVRVEVEDDGRGFETNSTDDGYGLATIRERLDVAGGRLDVASAPGAGTCIRLAIPIGGASVASARAAPASPIHKRFPSSEGENARERTWDTSRSYSSDSASKLTTPHDLSDLPG